MQVFKGQGWGLVKKGFRGAPARVWTKGEFLSPATLFSFASHLLKYTSSAWFSLLSSHSNLENTQGMLKSLNRVSSSAYASPLFSSSWLCFLKTSSMLSCISGLRPKFLSPCVTTNASSDPLVMKQGNRSTFICSSIPGRQPSIPTSDPLAISTTTNYVPKHYILLNSQWIICFYLNLWPQ